MSWVLQDELKVWCGDGGYQLKCEAPCTCEEPGTANNRFWGKQAMWRGEIRSRQALDTRQRALFQCRSS